MASDKDYIFNMLAKGFDAGSSGAKTYLEKQAALEHLLKGKQADLSNKRSEMKDAQDLAAKMVGIDPNDPEAMSNVAGALAKKGQSMSFGPEHLAIGGDHSAQNQKGAASALQHAHDVYLKGLPKIQDTVKAAQMGLEAANDPKQTGSLGAVRTLLLKTFGMNRYNENEANALVPPTVRGAVAGFFNKGGDDSSPLNDSQRAAVNQIFTGTLNHAKSSHDALKQNSLNTYATSPYFDATRMDSLKGALGGPVESDIAGSLSKYKDLPTTGAPSTPSAAPFPSMADKALTGLKSLFGMGDKPSAPQAPAAQAAPQAAPPQAPRPMSPPQISSPIAAPQAAPQAPRPMGAPQISSPIAAPQAQPQMPGVGDPAQGADPAEAAERAELDALRAKHKGIR